MKNLKPFFIISFLLVSHLSFSQLSEGVDTGDVYIYGNTDIQKVSDEMRELDRKIDESRRSSWGNLGLGVSTNTNVPLNSFRSPPKPFKNPLDDYQSTDVMKQGLEEMKEEMSKPSLDYMTQPVSYDPIETNRDRFVNSPCYYELGFNPFADPEQQELKYKRCEEEKRKKNVSKVINQSYDGLVTIIGVLVFSLILFVVGYYTLNFINKSPTLELKDVLKAITIGGLIFIGLVMLKFLKII